MESSSLLLLLEKVLTGRPGDPNKHAENYAKLHENLIQTNQSTLRAAIITLREMFQKDQISDEIYLKFSQYLNCIMDNKKPLPPNLGYLTFSSNPSCLRSAKFFHALQKLSMRRSIGLKKGIDGFKMNRFMKKIGEIEGKYFLKVRKEKVRLLVANLKKYLGVNVQRAFSVWGFRGAVEKKEMLRRVLEKARVRIFYMKYITLERWYNDTWDQQEFIEENWENEEYYQKFGRKKIKKKELWDSYTIYSLKDVFKNMTERTNFMQKYDVDDRIDTLQDATLKKNILKSKLEAVVNRIIAINKLRKQMPNAVLSSWAGQAHAFHADLLYYCQGFNIIQKLSKNREAAYFSSILLYKNKEFTGYKMIKLLKNIGKMRLKDAYLRILGPGNKVRNYLEKLTSHFTRRKINVLSKWKDYAKESKFQDFIENTQRTKLSQALGKIATRTNYGVLQIVTNMAKARKNNLNTIVQFIKKVQKKPFDRWKQSINESNEKAHFTKQRGYILSKHLNLLPTKTLKNAFKKLVPSSKTQAYALKILLSKLQKKPKNLISRWRNICQNYKDYNFYAYIRNMKFIKILNKVPACTQKLSFDRIILKQKLLDQKAKVSKASNLMNLLVTYLHNSITPCLLKPISIRKNQKILISAIKALNKNPSKLLNSFFDKWARASGSNIKDRKKIQALKLLNLAKIVDKNKQKAFNDFATNLDEKNTKKLKKTNRKLKRNLKKKTLLGQKAAATSLINAIKSSGLNRTLADAYGNITNTIKKNYAEAVLSIALGNFKKKMKREIMIWKDNTIKSEYKNLENRLKDEKNDKRRLKFAQTLRNLPKKKLKMALSRIVLAESRIAECLSNVYFTAKRMPKSSFDLWRFNSAKINKSALMNKIKGQKIIDYIKKCLRKTLRTGFNRIIGTSPKVKLALKNMMDQLKGRLRKNWSLWNRYCERSYQEDVIRKFKGEKFKYLLERPLKNNISKVFDDMISDRRKEYLLKIITIFKNHLSEVLSQWNTHTQTLKIMSECLRLSNHAFNDELPYRDLSKMCNKNSTSLISSNVPFQLSSKIKSSIKNIMKIFSKSIRSSFNHLKSEKAAKLEKKIISLRMANFLNKLSRRTIKQSYNSIISWGDYIKKTLIQLSVSCLEGVKLNFLKWKSIVNDDIKKVALKSLKTLKCKTYFESIVKRTMRDSSTRIIIGFERMESTMDGLVNSLKGIPRVALRRWNKVVIDIVQTELKNSILIEKILKHLSRIPRRTFKGTLNRIMTVELQNSKLKLYLKMLSHLWLKHPKEFFDQWKKYVAFMKENSIMKDYNIQFMKINFEKIIRRTLKDVIRRIQIRGMSIKEGLKLIGNFMQKGAGNTFARWKDFVKIAQGKDIIYQLKKKLANASLLNLCKKIIRDAYHRILGGGDKVKGTMQGLVNGLNNIPKVALRRWNKAVIEIKHYEVVMTLKGNQVKNFMNKVSIRTLNEAVESIKNDKFKFNLALCITKMGKILLRKYKPAFDKWKNGSYEITNANLLEQLRESKITFSLRRIYFRVTWDAVQRMLGEGNRIKGAFRIYISAILRRPKMAFDRWKYFLVLVKQLKLLDSLKSLKLKNHLKQIVLRKIRDATQRIIGGGNKIKGALQSIITRLKIIPLNALIRWSKTVKLINEKKLMDNVRSEKLKGRFLNIVRGKLRVVLKRIVSNEASISFVKSMFKWLEKAAKSKPKKYFKTWLCYTKEATRKLLKLKVLGHRLEDKLKKIAKRTEQQSFNRIIRQNKGLRQAFSTCNTILKKIPRTVFNKFKNFSEQSVRNSILKELTGQRFLNIINRIINKHQQIMLQRITKRSEKASKALKNITDLLKNKAKHIFRKWVKYVDLVKGNVLTKVFSGALKLQSIAKLFGKNCMKNFMEILKVLNSEVNNKNLGLRALKKILMKFLKVYYDQWKRVTNKMNERNQVLQTRALKVANIIEKMQKKQDKKRQKTAKKVGSFVDRVRMAIRTLNIYIKKNYKEYFEKWKKIVEMIKNKTQNNNIKALKLKRTLDKILKKNLKNRFKLWNSYIFLQTNNKQKLVGQRLKNYLKNICKRTTRTICNNIFINKKKMKSAINVVVANLTVKPKQVIKKWKHSVNIIREKILVDAARYQKLANYLEKLSKRTTNEAFNRITDIAVNSLIVSFNLKWVNKILQQRPKYFFSLWKGFIQNLKQKELLDHIRSNTLLRLFGNISRRGLRDSVQRILGEGNKVKGALKTIVSNIKSSCKKALDQWRKNSDDIARKKLLDNLKLQNLRSAIERASLRRLRSILNLITTGEEKIRTAVTTVITSLKTKPKHYLKKWKNTVQQLHEQLLINDMRYSRLKNHLEKVCIRTTRDSFDHMLFALSNSVCMNFNLKSIYKILLKKTKCAMDIWKNLIEKAKEKEMLDKIRSQKLQLLLGHAHKRLARELLQKIIGEGSRVRGVFKLIYTNLKKMPRKAFENLKRNNEECKRKILMDNYRCSKLKDHLSKVIAKTSRELYENIVHKNVKVKRAIGDLLASLKTKRDEAFRKMKNKFMEEKYTKLSKSHLAHIFQSYMKNLVKNKLECLINRMKNACCRNNNLKFQSFLKISKVYDCNRKGHFFNNWRVASLKTTFALKMQVFKGKLLGNTMKSIIEGLKKKSINKIVCGEQVLKRLFKYVENMKKNVLMQKFAMWKARIRMKELPNKVLALHCLRKVCNKQTKKVFSKICMHLQKGRIIGKIVRNLMENQRLGIIGFKERVRKLILIKKLTAAQTLLKLLKVKAKIMIKGRFIYWKNLEAIRIYRLRKKVIMKWIYIASINFQNSFWKMKFVWNKNFKYFDPKHAVMYKKLSKIASNYQTRLKQYAHFKLVMFYKTEPDDVYESPRRARERSPAVQRRSSETRALAFINRPSSRASIERALTPLGFRDKQVTPIRCSTPISYRANENRYVRTPTDMKPPIPNSIAISKTPVQFLISTPTNLPTEEIIRISQIGAIEIIFTHIKNIVTRFKITGIAFIAAHYKHSLAFETQKCNYIETIEKLRNDNTCLLQDNETLRNHNEVLVENLMKANENLVMATGNFEQEIEIPGEEVEDIREDMVDMEEYDRFSPDMSPL
ncbi:hypothetical protein SteCoe_10583 [Stentor coeruleus]|uniref:Uncharacterized protein n=1 Tax=Stentor coeruleus TaxID=5963 RepID=A0A1R2CF52_9CILI|nr:hypothetical protein SteCoe_10583 [Stentor coeruleus]